MASFLHIDCPDLHKNCVQIQLIILSFGLSEGSPLLAAWITGSGRLSDGRAPRPDKSRQHGALLTGEGNGALVPGQEAARPVSSLFRAIACIGAFPCPVSYLISPGCACW
jgi:hypothetical protein